MSKQITPTGYAEPPTNFDEYALMVGVAQDANNGSAWALGDLYDYGESRFRDTYNQVFDETKKSLRTIQNYASICRAFTPSRRRASLSMSHHAAVKALDEHTQDMLLDEAERKGYSRDELRARASEEKGLPEKQDPIKSECKVIDLVKLLTQDYGLSEDDIVQFSIKVIEPDNVISLPAQGMKVAS